MTYNLLEEITDYDGTPLIKQTIVKDEDTRQEIPITYKDAIYTLLTTSNLNLPYTAEQIVMANAIVLRIYDHPDNVELSKEETGLILSRKTIYLSPRIPSELERFLNQKN